MFDLAALHVDLQGQQQGEGHLVLLVETTCRVLVNFERHVLDNVHDSLGRDRGLLRSERKKEKERKFKFTDRLFVFSRSVSLERSDLSTHYGVRMYVFLFVCLPRCNFFGKGKNFWQQIWLDTCSDPANFFFSSLHLTGHLVISLRADNTRCDLHTCLRPKYREFSSSVDIFI